MAGNSRARLLHLVGLDYRRNAWRRGREVDGLLAQVSTCFLLQRYQTVQSV